MRVSVAIQGHATTAILKKIVWYGFNATDSRCCFFFLPSFQGVSFHCLFLRHTEYSANILTKTYQRNPNFRLGTKSPKSGPKSSADRDDPAVFSKSANPLNVYRKKQGAIPYNEVQLFSMSVTNSNETILLVGN